MRTTAFIVALVATIASGSVSAFTFQKSVARRSALSMNVEQAKSKDIIKVGVIGMGRIGLVHLEAITKAPGVIPVIVSNPTVSKAEAGTKNQSWALLAARTLILMSRFENPTAHHHALSHTPSPSLHSRPAVQHSPLHCRRHGCH